MLEELFGPEAQSDTASLSTASPAISSSINSSMMTEPNQTSTNTLAISAEPPAASWDSMANASQNPAWLSETLTPPGNNAVDSLPINSPMTQFTDNTNATNSMDSMTLPDNLWTPAADQVANPFAPSVPPSDIFSIPSQADPFGMPASNAGLNGPDNNLNATPFAFGPQDPTMQDLGPSASSPNVAAPTVIDLNQLLGLPPAGPSSTAASPSLESMFAPAPETTPQPTTAEPWLTAEGRPNVQALPMSAIENIISAEPGASVVNVLGPEAASAVPLGTEPEALSRQDILDALEQVAVRGQGSGSTYQALQGLVNANRPNPDAPGKPFNGPSNVDDIFLNQAGLWAWGMLARQEGSDQPGNANSAQYQAFVQTAGDILGNMQYNSDIQLASLQAIQVINSNDSSMDPAINAILTPVAEKPKWHRSLLNKIMPKRFPVYNEQVRLIAKETLDGKVIQLESPDSPTPNDGASTTGHGCSSSIHVYA